MTSLRSEQASIPFEARDPYWAERCLAVSSGQVVRIVRRETVPAAATGMPQWCIAQTAGGEIGLLPAVILRRADAQDDFPTPGPRTGSRAVTAAARNTGHRTARKLHMDPMTADIQREEETYIADDAGNISRVVVALVSDATTKDDEVMRLVSPSTPSFSSSAEDVAPKLDSDAAPVRQATQAWGAPASDDDDEEEEAGSRPHAAALAPVWSYPPWCRGDPEAQEVYAQLSLVRAESEALERARRRIDQGTVVAEKQAATTRAARTKQQAAAKARTTGLQAEIRRLKEACDSVKDLRHAVSTGAATTTTMMGVLASRDPNGSLGGPVAKGNAADLVTAELLCCERETLEAYRGQHQKLGGRQAKLARLAAELEEESRAVQVSERALAAVAPAGEWPATLDGLTAEEAEVLASLVQAHDKYEAKRRAVETEAPRDVAKAQLEKLLSRVERGDAEAAKVAEETEKLRAFVKKHSPLVDKLREQIRLGEEVLAKKKALLDSLSGSLVADKV